MSINHHPDQSTLVSYAAGSLPQPFEVLVAWHLQHCPQCQMLVAEAEALGGMMLESLEPVPLIGMPDIEALLSHGRESGAGAGAGWFDAAQPAGGEVSPEAAIHEPELWQRTIELPDELARFQQEGADALPWKWLVPGIQQIQMSMPGGTLRLLKIAPGISIPLHSHGGSELTLVLEGSFSDEVGRFKAGDVADLDEQTEHQPITDGNVDCICLVATDAPLRFSGLLPRILQPVTGF